MPQAKFTDYYKNAMKKILDYLNKKQRLAIRLDRITRDGAIFTIGVSDGNDFVLEFGTVECPEGQRVDVVCDSIYIDLTKLIHMEYNTNPVTREDISFNLLEEYNK